jgi:hypothetical protein
MDPPVVLQLETMNLDIGILLALACAFVANLGFFYKYRGANSVPSVSVLHPVRSTRELYSSKWFALGMLIATASWGLHVAALALAPMSVIQISLAAGMVFIAVMAERMFGFKVGRRQWVGLTLTAVGLVLLGITLPAMHGAHSHFSQAAMISFEAGLFGIGALLLMGPRMGGPVEHHRVLLQVVSLSGDVGRYLDRSRDAHTRDLAQRGVRLLRGRGVHAGAHAAPLRSGGLLLAALA